MLLIAFWAMFSLSQAFAACCGPHGNQRQGTTEFFSAFHPIEAATRGDHGEFDELPCDDPDNASCTVVFEDVALPVLTPAAASNYGSFPQALVLSIQSTASAFAGHAGPGQGSAYLSLAPPAPIYLRFQRFLI